MRISGGTAKGRRTATKRLITNISSGERLRPTSSKVREALFDILRDRIGQASFVDLYAGTGTVGFEALSRGAQRAVFVEPDALRSGKIRSSAAELGFQDTSRVIRNEACKFLKMAIAGQEIFDIFFLDPPYQSDEIERVLPIIGENKLLSERGLVIVEHFSKKKVPETAGILRMAKTYKYGDTVLTLYTKADV
jgi:16S rRNA (guanine966-N2)-methyltransferase